MRFLFVLFLFTFQAQALDLEVKELRFKKGTKVKVEVADTFIKRANGLMNRTKLPENQGMLFIFDRPQKLSFWNKNTFIPLDLAYFDKNKVLKEIHAMEPVSMMDKKQNNKTYPSRCDCQYVLEVNRGWFKKHKVKIGSQFSIHPFK